MTRTYLDTLPEEIYMKIMKMAGNGIQHYIQGLQNAKILKFYCHNAINVKGVVRGGGVFGTPVNEPIDCWGAGHNYLRVMKDFEATPARPRPHAYEKYQVACEQLEYMVATLKDVEKIKMRGNAEYINLEPILHGHRAREHWQHHRLGLQRYWNYSKPELRHILCNASPHGKYLKSWTRKRLSQEIMRY